MVFNKNNLKNINFRGRKREIITIDKKTYDELDVKGIYETFDYAEFLKNNEQFKESIIYYSKILNQIDKDHPLYPEITDGRGVSYERTSQWDKAEKDLLNSLNASPEQAYVINYLAYSWIEQGIKIEESLKMLEKANRIKNKVKVPINKKTRSLNVAMTVAIIASEALRQNNFI